MDYIFSGAPNERPSALAALIPHPHTISFVLGCLLGAASVSVIKTNEVPHIIERLVQVPSCTDADIDMAITGLTANAIEQMGVLSPALTTKAQKPSPPNIPLPVPKPIRGAMK